MIGGTSLAGDRREAREHIGLLANCRKNAGLGVLADIPRYRKGAERTPAFRMHGTLGNALTVLVREFLEQLIILQQYRPVGAGRDGVLIVRNRTAGRGGKGGAFAHDTAPGTLLLD